MVDISSRPRSCRSSPLSRTTASDWPLPFENLGWRRDGYFPKLPVARAYLREARAGYLRCGADAKVALLDEQFQGIDRPVIHARATTIEASVEQLDLSAMDATRSHMFLPLRQPIFR